MPVPLPAAEDDWVDHHNEITQMTLLPRANSWWVGANIPGRPRHLCPYTGGVGTYRLICDEVTARDYDGFTHGSGAAATDGDFTGVARATFLVQAVRGDRRRSWSSSRSILYLLPQRTIDAKLLA
ncbi:hypothetical protein [Pseudonocardia sp. T1-2H]|uniref:hypothetical protein n=1 Tax=Pseudonocardia sp. T1-2H TaxID=3128899 RepID=UPI00310189BC